MATTSAEHVIIWDFSVRPGKEAVFERKYGPDGDWARLFASSPDFRGTELLMSTGTPRRYITVDRWTSAASFASFYKAHHAEYAALDAECEPLTESEVPQETWMPISSGTGYF